jgi:hypothetical protein
MTVSLDGFCGSRSPPAVRRSACSFCGGATMEARGVHSQKCGIGQNEDRLPRGNALTDTPDLPSIEELVEHLYSSLPTDERDQFLQELLVAAARGDQAMVGVLEAWLLDAAGRELLTSLGEQK